MTPGAPSPELLLVRTTGATVAAPPSVPGAWRAGGVLGGSQCSWMHGLPGVPSPARGLAAGPHNSLRAFSTWLPSPRRTSTTTGDGVHFHAAEDKDGGYHSCPRRTPWLAPRKHRRSTRKRATPRSRASHARAHVHTRTHTRHGRTGTARGDYAHSAVPESPLNVPCRPCFRTRSDNRNPVRGGNA